MRAYVIRRLLLVVPTLLILSMIVFLLVRFIPGDVIDAMQEEYAFTAGEIDREALERKDTAHRRDRVGILAEAMQATNGLRELQLTLRIIVRRSVLRG